MPAEERASRAQRLKAVLVERDPGDWIDEQISDIRRKARGQDATVVEPAPPARAAE
jgi:trehalose 6-phosphate synthase